MFKKLETVTQETRTPEKADIEKLLRRKIDTMTGSELTALIVAAFRKVNPEKPEREYLTTSQAAEFLQVTRPTLLNWGKTKGLKSYKIGVKVRYKKTDLVEFVTQQTEAAGVMEVA